MKKGTIRVKSELYYGNYAMFYPVLAYFIITNINYDPLRNTYYLTGECSMFENINDGDQIPFYDVVIWKIKGKRKPMITFTKCIERPSYKPDYTDY